MPDTEQFSSSPVWEPQILLAIVCAAQDAERLFFFCHLRAREWDSFSQLDDDHIRTGQGLLSTALFAWWKVWVELATLWIRIVPLNNTSHWSSTSSTHSFVQLSKKHSFLGVWQKLKIVILRLSYFPARPILARSTFVLVRSNQMIKRQRRYFLLRTFVFIKRHITSHIKYQKHRQI